MCLPYRSFILLTKLNKSSKVTSVQDEFSDKLLLNDQGGCSAFCQYIWFMFFYFFIFHCLLIVFVVFPSSEWLQWISKRVINRGTALHWCDYSAPRSAGSISSPGSGIFAFFAAQYGRRNAFSLPKLLKLFSTQRLIILPSSYNLLIRVSLTPSNKMSYPYAVPANINVFFPNKTASNCLSCVWAIIHVGSPATASI